MIVRLAASAAIHTAGGVAMGVTAVLAACTVAQVAKKVVEHAPRPGRMDTMRPGEGSVSSRPPEPEPNPRPEG